jgi:hypothetical protein
VSAARAIDRGRLRDLLDAERGRFRALHPRSAQAYAAALAIRARTPTQSISLARWQRSWLEK